MNNTFEDTEKLFRAIWPENKRPDFWKKPRNGRRRLSAAALKDPNGLSLEREYNREKKDVLNSMREYFSGHIASFTALQCKEVSAVLRYLPTERSVYHSEVHQSETKKILSDEQAEILSKAILIEEVDPQNN